MPLDILPAGQFVSGLIATELAKPFYQPPKKFWRLRKFVKILFYPAIELFMILRGTIEKERCSIPGKKLVMFSCENLKKKIRIGSLAKAN